MSSSWDRSRRIPWSRIDQQPPPLLQGGVAAQPIDAEAQRERILRTLARERALVESEEEQDGLIRDAKFNLKENRNSDCVAGEKVFDSSALQNQHHNLQGKGGLILNGLNFSGKPFLWGELGRQVSFGVIMGSITGSAFGFMDGVRQTADNSKILKRASNAAKVNFLFQGTVRTGLTFGAFFGGFHAVSASLACLSWSEINRYGPTCWRVIQVHFSECLFP